ncbi:MULTISPECIES: archaeosine biosynthesis radical SAM protein RaSEA [Halomicrobium]|uniref:Radical SAM domain protein n=2 Tax=Halomicrobium mukohataei TaxID=57705 RepID=C7P377_HALMD|nr:MULTISPECIES: archaeosine biosynthesis radical SAM protein RaSEA [Halomicrobium]ACV47549.1 Radical SAM domain protein [Halomicrobium mukohataei DSM 12286]QCD66012.1 TIGR01210 family radical SAM protein [Halomicrobium mukohataei]QFR20817.1 TIGR01210 family radical SAM protein [Halomicrobium sp. ZPS1]
MSTPTPEVYEQGKGMDAHNKVMREVRSRNDASYDPREPTRVWLDEDNTPDGVYQSLTIILNTGGCRWARAGGCTMCGYVAESVDGGSVAHEDLMAQIQYCLDHEDEEADEKAGLIKIYTSGSFLDEREVGAETRRAIAETFADRDRIVVESLPDFVDREKVAEFVDAGLETDIAVGLETATDRVRRDCVNKYFDFSDFEDAAAQAQAAGGGVKAYLLMKPPFLTESEAIEDMQRSVRKCADVEGCHTVSMNPCNVQRYTMVEELFHDQGYRPPWLWSVCEVLESTADEDVIVVSDPVGHGSDRGPHNCGECDDRAQRAIKDFDLRQDPSVFEQVTCDCEATWDAVVEREASYSLPLAR